MKRGIFIAFEGGEGAGKSTQIARLQEALVQKKIHVLTTREPGGTPGAEHLRTLLKYKDGWDHVSEALMMYAARWDLCEKIIQPALSKGTWVLCDRFAHSTFAYQGYGRGLSLSFLHQLHQLILGDFYPDLVILLTISPEEGLKRARARHETLDRFEEMDIGFHERLHAGYQQMARDDPRFFSVDAGLPPEQITPLILGKIDAYLSGDPQCGDHRFS